MKLQLFLTSAALIGTLSNTVFENPHTGVNESTTHVPKLFISCPNRISGGEVSECKVGIDPATEKEVTIKITNSNTALIKLSVDHVTLAPNQYSATVSIRSSATPIRSTVVIKASAVIEEQRVTEESIDVVPALFASVRLAKNSFIGTKGAEVRCEVKLRAPAPVGGIEIYLSPLNESPRTNPRPVYLDRQNPKVSAGEDFVNFAVAYNDLRVGSERINQFAMSGHAGSISDFNLQTRTAELIVALEPQRDFPWQPITGLAHRVVFDVVPLRVTSLVSQPASLIGGTEALATFTLSASPGSSEVAFLSPIRFPSAKVWPVVLSSSCAAQAGTTVATQTGQGTLYDGPIELALIPGTTTYSLKVCTAVVSTTVSERIHVVLRSGFFDATITIRPN